MKNLSLVLITAIFLGGCSDVKLESYLRYASTQGGIDYCTTPADTVKSNLKFIIVVDKSGSNQPGNDPNNPAGTDPTGARRYGALAQFVQNFPADPSVYWSMINFSTANITSEVFPQNPPLGFSNNQAAMLAAINTQQATTAQNDTGWTDYLAALTLIKNLITTDVANAAAAVAAGQPAVSSDYVIFFVTDGAPYVVGTPPVLQSTASILNSISTGIMSLQNVDKEYIDSIQLNTGFYYVDNGQSTEDVIAQSLLSSMAVAGNGTALTFGLGQSIDFSQFSIPTRIAKFMMKDFWVTNMNTVWENGKLKHDSDADGLSDELEAQLGSNPLAYDSDGNGVGDGVEYRITGAPCQDAACSAAKAAAYLQCGSVAIPGKTGLAKYADKDNDNLNDCEETILGSDPQNFDTNFDYIPDWIAFRNNIAMLAGTSDANLDPDNDGYTNYQELKMNTPLNYANDQIANLQMMKMNIYITSDSSLQTCYHIDVTNMGYFANDMIRVEAIESRQVISQRRVLRVAEKPLVGGRINFSPNDFN